MSNVKQVIVMRKDLKMRRGKEIAQGSHASIHWLTTRIQENPEVEAQGLLTLVEHNWVMGNFAKVCLQINSEAELIDIYDRAKHAGLTVSLIVDAGLTEFGGVPTKTCLAIGPNLSEEIDKITGHLTLY